MLLSLCIWSLCDAAWDLCEDLFSSWLVIMLSTEIEMLLTVFGRDCGSETLDTACFRSYTSGLYACPAISLLCDFCAYFSHEKKTADDKALNLRSCCEPPRDTSDSMLVGYIYLSSFCRVCMVPDDIVCFVSGKVFSSIKFRMRGHKLRLGSALRL